MSQKQRGKKKVFQEERPGKLCAILLQSPGKKSKVTTGSGHPEVMATLPRTILTERGDRRSEGMSGEENRT